MSKVKRHRVKVVFAGVEWDSITAMAAYYNITPTAIQKALQRGSWYGKPIRRA